jgi:hypothetical protein
MRSARRVSLGLLLVASTGAAALPARADSIEHSAIGCVVAERFPRVEARFDPANGVARARVYFRAHATPHWYFVEMETRTGALFAALPKPKETLTQIDYYIEVAGSDSALHRTPDYGAQVVSSESECGSAAAGGASTAGASVLVHAAESGAPVLPAGFSTAGLTAAPGAATAGGAAGATSAGISKTTIVLGTVGAAAVAGGVVAAVAHGGDGESSLTGRWMGTAPDGLIDRGTTGCYMEADLDLSLTQSGGNLSGTLSYRVRTSPGGRDCLAVGTQSPPTPLSGTVAGSSVHFRINTGEGTTASFDGTSASNRIEGTWREDVSQSGHGSGSWSVRRQ